MHRSHRRPSALVALLASVTMLSGCGAAKPTPTAGEKATVSSSCPATAPVSLPNTMPAARRELVPTGAQSVKVCFFQNTNTTAGLHLVGSGTSAKHQTVTQLSSALDALTPHPNMCPARYHPSTPGLAAFAHFSYRSGATDTVEVDMVSCQHGNMTIEAGANTNGLVTRYLLDANVLGDLQTIANVKGATSGGSAG